MPDAETIHNERAPCWTVLTLHFARASSWVRSIGTHHCLLEQTSALLLCDTKYVPSLQQGCMAVVVTESVTESIETAGNKRRIIRICDDGVSYDLEQDHVPYFARESEPVVCFRYSGLVFQERLQGGRHSKIHD